MKLIAALLLVLAGAARADDDLVIEPGSAPLASIWKHRTAGVVSPIVFKASFTARGCTSTLVDDNGRALTVTRSTTGALTNPLLGSASLCSAGQARVERAGLRVSEGETNLITWSESPDNVAWVTSNVNVSQVDTANDPFGQRTADTITTLASGGLIETPNVTAAGGVRYTYGAWVKATSGTQDFQFVIRDTTASLSYCVSTVTATTVWQYFACTTTAAITAGNVLQGRIFPGTSTGTGTLVIANSMFNSGTYPKPYCKSTASTATCNAEDIQYTSSGTLGIAGNGSVIATWAPPANGTDMTTGTSMWALRPASGSGGVELVLASATSAKCRWVDTTNAEIAAATVSGLTFTQGVQTRMKCRWQTATNVCLSVDGAAETCAGTVPGANVPTLTRFLVGESATGSGALPGSYWNACVANTQTGCNTAFDPPLDANGVAMLYGTTGGGRIWTMNSALAPIAANDAHVNWSTTTNTDPASQGGGVWRSCDYTGADSLPTTLTGSQVWTSGSAAISCASGCLFTTETKPFFQISPDNVTWYVVSSITDANHLTLTTNSTVSTTKAGSNARGPCGQTGAGGSNSGLRIEVSTLNGEANWKNVEMTGYVKLQLARAPTEEWSWYARSGVGHNGTVDNCDGDAYHSQLDYDGSGVWSQKEIWHNGTDSGGYTSTHRGEITQLSGAWTGKWVGYKYVLFDAPDESSDSSCGVLAGHSSGDPCVRGELWYDPNNAGVWLKLIEWMDDGHWLATRPGTCGRVQNYVMSEARTTATFRWDNAIVDFQKMGIREITPPNP